MRLTRPILEGFPNRKLVKLRYVENQLSMDPTTANFDSYAFRANSVFDPDVQLGGHNPMGFNQWAAIYRKYTVLGAKISMQYTPTATGNTAPGFFGILLANSPTDIKTYSSDINALLESKECGGNYKIAGPVSTVDSAGRFAQVRKRFSSKKWFGVKDVLDNSNLTALTSADPVTQAYFVCWIAAIDGNDPARQPFKVVIDYIVMFQEPHLLPGS